MKINGLPYRTIALSGDRQSVRVIDQRRLPWELVFADLTSLDDAVAAIGEMWVRGAPLIGVTAAYGLYLALKTDASDRSLQDAYDKLLASRPTAINLKWALDAMLTTLKTLPPEERLRAAEIRATEICEEDVTLCQSIGRHGAQIIEALAAQKKPGEAVHILTHCNAGWLATVDYGTALAPIYTAHDRGIPVHVWVDETRPRNQGAFLTAFELAQHGVPHTVIVDNAGGLLMRQGRVDMCIVGADRVSRNGDVCNKIGTYLKALAASDNRIPFYVAFPYTTIDYTLAGGEAIPIEERSPVEVSHMQGKGEDGSILEIAVTSSPVANPAFDITPARLVTGYVTEKGVLDRVDMLPVSKAG